MTPQRNAKFMRILPILLVIALILLLSLIPGPKAGSLIKSITDPIRRVLYRSETFSFIATLNPLKVGHVIAYGLLDGV